MTKRSPAITTSIALFALGVVVLSAYGALTINWPWNKLPDVASNEVTVTYDAPARIVEIEPIGLDCRARVHAEVPVNGRKEHSVFGQVYRTDTVEVLAIGDIDTCLSADAVEITETAPGSVRVTIPAESIQFVRPRVDAIATQDSVRFDKGFVGKLTDALPWVSDQEGLTPAGYAFAQTVIGGSECMEQAYELTKSVLLDAYAEQATGLGLGQAAVEVQIVGEPDFAQNDIGADLGDFDFRTDDDSVFCEVTADPSDGLDPIPTPDPVPEHADPRTSST
ncbi:MAG: hypothetical protein OEU32_01385 [Acidimicrobiia bacterium]|nr:hypothetical protein [Acidimicrobiia bacterium]